MNEVTQNFDNEVIKKSYLKLKNIESKFKFMQIWSQVEDPKNFKFFIDQISEHDVETSEIVFDNLRNWNLDKKSKLELLEAIKEVGRKSELLNITIEKLNERI